MRGQADEPDRDSLWFHVRGQIIMEQGGGSAVSNFSEVQLEKFLSEFSIRENEHCLSQKTVRPKELCAVLFCFRTKPKYSITVLCNSSCAGLGSSFRVFLPLSLSHSHSHPLSLADIFISVLILKMEYIFLI